MINNEIERVIFITDEKKTCIFFKDGTLKYVPIEEGKKAASELVIQDQVKKEELDKYTKIEFLSQKELYKNYNPELLIREYYTRNLQNEETKRKKDIEQLIHELNKNDENSNENEVNNTKCENDDSSNKKTNKCRSNKVKSAAIIISISSLAFTGWLLNHKSTNTATKKEISVNIDDTNATIEKITNISSLLEQKNINDSRKEFISSAYDYLYDYNYEFSNNHIDENTNTKLALSFDEVAAQLLIYGNYSSEELFNILGYYKYNTDDIYKIYNSSIEQEIIAHTVQKESLNKQFYNKKQKDFYDKYEKLNISYNKQKNIDDKEEIAKTIFNELRNDIDFEKDKLPEGIEVIKPIINSIMQKTNESNISNRLTSKELEYFNEFIDENIRTKICNIDSELSDSVSLNRSFGIKEEITYEDIRKIVINDLEDNNLNNVEEYQRDTTNHNEYQKELSYFNKR